MRPQPAHPSVSSIAELLIVGTGPLARALVGLAEAAGFHVRVAAGPEIPSVGEFEGADEVIVTPTPGSVEALRPGSNTFVVVCSDDTEFSGPVLESLASTKVPYIGIAAKDVGTSAGVEQQSSDPRVHSPAGIQIGAATPEEMAIGILAEIVAIRRSTSASVS